jgi:thiol:disulfide interchange protein DsbD
MKRPFLLSLLAASFGLLLLGQGNVLQVVPGDVVKAKAGSSVTAKLKVELRQGYHVNSDKPADEYLIPLRLTWNDGVLNGASVSYPKPQMEKLPFADKPMAVYTGEFDLTTTFKVSPTAPAGPAAVTGKLRYQACNDRMCLAPKNLDVNIQLDIVK